jgi:hypothetical protein
MMHPLKLSNTYYEDHHHIKLQEDNVSIEVAMVLIANTVINPRTVMVKSLNTPSTDIAMTTSLTLDELALGTEGAWIKFRDY